MNSVYLETARLLTQVAPVVFADGRFALKGGTAINLFLRDMPRLSVDLDLVFTDHRPDRAAALDAINIAMRRAAGALEARGLQTRATAVAEAGETKLLVRRDRIEVKVEVNFVMRGTVHPIRTAPLMPKAQAALLAELELPILAPEEIYGGKLVAALDRQHPRDLFDVMELLGHEGITPGIRRGFVIYLASHNRPIHEVLFPARKDIAQEFERTFRGMTAEPVALDALLAARERLIADLHGALDASERQFLLSLAHAEPDWNVLGIAHLEQLPALRWKLQNLRQLARRNPAKLREQADALAAGFDAIAPPARTA